MTARKFQSDFAGLGAVAEAHFSANPISTEQSPQAPQPMKICIGCGARQSADGALPCGH